MHSSASRGALSATLFASRAQGRRAFRDACWSGLTDVWRGAAFACGGPASADRVLARRISNEH